MSERPRRRWWRIAIEIAIVVALVLAFQAWQSRSVAGGRAPALEGTSVDGSPLSLPAAPGEPVLVHFWATWCGVCRAEEGTIASLAESHRVITVASQSGGAPDVSRYMREAGVRFPVLVDRRGALAARWGVSAFPTTFVIGPDGIIRDVEVGYTTSLGLRARLFLAR